MGEGPSGPEARTKEAKRFRSVCGQVTGRAAGKEGPRLRPLNAPCERSEVSEGRSPERGRAEREKITPRSKFWSSSHFRS